MVKKNTNEHAYFKDLRNFLTYHFNKTPGNETKLANVLEYCKSNWKSIGEEEVVDVENAAIKTLLELRPIDLVHYFEFLAYGTENVQAGAKPTGKRSNSLLAYKRSISYYMPLRSDYDVFSNRGNPTKAKSVNTFIKKIKQFEARNLGAKSQVKRAYTVDEFNRCCKRGKKKVLKREPYFYRFVFSAILVLQNCLAGRIDDMIMLDTDEIKRSRERGLLEIRLTWSKNIYNENASYYQLVMGSMDPNLCPLIALGAYVGYFENIGEIEKHADRERPVVDPDDPNWATKQHQEPILPGFFRMSKNEKVTKQRFRGRLNKINDLEEITGCSTHSTRKKACEEMQDCQLHRKISVQRGRWIDGDEKQASAIYHKRLNKGYDYKAAHCLAGPLGSCRYHVEGLTEQIVKEILPAGDSLKDGVAEILTCAVIWAAKDEDARILIPTVLQERIAAYEKAHGNFIVTRQRLRVYCNRDVVKIVDDLGNNDADVEWNEKADLIIDEVRSLKRQCERESQLNAKRFKAMNSRMDNVTLSINRVVVFRSGNSNNLNGPPDLYNCKTLNQLWAEYQYGLGGNKPARLFSVAERNAPSIKFRYHWRKKFWQAVAQLVRHTPAEVAIERLGRVYCVNQAGGLSGFSKRVGKDVNLTQYYNQHPI